MKNKCLIISGGDRSSIPGNGSGFDYIIACDKGYQYAIEANVRPDIIMGDFDSHDIPVTDIEIKKFPVLKDDTDTMLAIKEALSRGYTDITLCCALGGRFDHTFANIQSGNYVCHQNGKCSIFSDDTVMYFFKDDLMHLPRKDGWSLSVFSLSDFSEGVSIKGCKFNTEMVDICNHFPVGASNVWIDDVATVSCKKGIILIIESKLRGNEHI